MAANSNTQAIQVANNLINIGQQLYELQLQINAATTQYSQLTLGTTFSAMTTTALNSDGTLGTVDGTVTSGHVIDPRVYTSLSRSISATDLASLNTLLGAVSTLLSGSAVSQQGQSPQLLNKIVGG